MSDVEVTDQGYHTAVGRTLGRFFAGMFAEMVREGMEREEALDVVIAYAEALARNRRSGDE